MSFTVSSIYPDSIRTTRQAKVLNISPNRLTKRDFVLMGMGDRGEYCGSPRVSHFTEDMLNIRVGRFSCKKVVCPECSDDWALHRTFDMAVKIWGYHLLTGQPVRFAVTSVRPSSVGEWTWDNINTSLYRRSYRVLKSKGGVGGYSLFHPLRVKPEVKEGLRAAGYAKRGEGESAGYWAGVKADALGLGHYQRYVKLGPHLHHIIFGDTDKCLDKDFLLRYLPGEKDLGEVIRYLRYLLTHVGVYMGQESKVSRSWGALYGLDIEAELGDDRYAALCQEIAESMSMCWDAENGLTYPCTTKEAKSGDDLDWLPIGFIRSRWWSENDLYPLGEVARFWNDVYAMYDTDKIVLYDNIVAEIPAAITVYYDCRIVEKSEVL